MVPGQERSDVGGHISTEPRINDRIRVPEVRLVGPSGEQVGIVSITDALRLAQESDLDLVEVAPTARPPVCKLMDFGKFKYESALKARESRKNQAQTVIKEIKIRPKIDPHDYGTKKGHVERFLRQGDKVKVTIMFRGREQSRPELGYKLLQRLAGDVEELGFVESAPKQDGRNMIMVIGPHRKKADTKVVRGPDRASARAAAPASPSGADDERVGATVAAPRPVAAAASAAPASRPAASGSATASPASGQTPEVAQPTFIRRAEPSATGPAASRPSQTSATGSGQHAPSSQSASRPGPRPGSATAGSSGSSATRSGPASASAAARPGPGSGSSAAGRPGPAAAGGSSARPGPAPSGPAPSSAAARPAASSAPKPGPAAGAAKPGPAAGAAKPAPPKPGPSGAARPSAPKPGPSGAARPGPPKPSAPRPSAAKPGEASPVPSPRAKPDAPGSAGAESGG
jgi:translation initiation factor IF-3